MKKRALPEVRSTDPYDFLFKKTARELILDLQDELVLLTSQAHIFGSPTNTTTVSNSFANSFVVVESNNLAWSGDRIIAPFTGMYFVAFNTISNNDATRKDSYIYRNGVIVASGLSEDTTTGFHFRGLSISLMLNSGDYIQFYNQNWYNNTSTVFDQWRSASVTLLRRTA